DPPRQTEDRMSPPCVAHFEGDNGGATYAGVTPTEVRIVMFYDGGQGSVTSRGQETTPTNTWKDLDDPPSPDDGREIRIMRAYQRYFNDRYQTYGRRVHMWIHFGGTAEQRTPEDRRAQAIEAHAKVDPFAILTFATANSDAYVDATTELGIATFLGTRSNGSFGQRASFFLRRPGLAWSYNPSLDNRADMYASYVCDKLLPHPVSFSGNLDHGQPRTFGLVRRDDPAATDFYNFGLLIKERLEGCGVEFVEGPWSNAAAGVAAFRQADVTTVLMTTASVDYTHAAAGISYYPELMIAGDDGAEMDLQGRLFNQAALQYARLITIYPAVLDPQAQPCFKAYRDADPEASALDARESACFWFHHLRQVFIGIQVAGPGLTPASMERGLRAIPAVQSGDPAVPACFYRPGDFTCVKDAQAQWWDPVGRPPDRNSTGCWRMMENGARYLAWEWPPGDPEEQRGTAETDPCNTQGADVT
ncbi:MAG TPA: hypothetical protein VGA36_05350, partial [Nitriliruptorales bacterium]